MTKSAKKSINLWTEQHEIFCLENKVPTAAQRLWQWLLWQGNVIEEIEPDLSEFNTWVEKWRGRKYTHNYLKSMFQLLCDLRVISIVKTYCWKIHKLIMRPLEWLKPRKKKNLQLSNFTYNSDPSNDSNAVVSSMQQQHSDLERNQETLASDGINFDTSETEVLSRPNWEIRAAIVLFKIRGGLNKIGNPEGWVRKCLRNRYWESGRNYLAIVFEVSGLTPYDDISGIELESIFDELYSLQQKTP